MADRVVNYSFTGSFTNLIGGLTAAGRATTDLGAKLTALDKNGAKARAGLTAVGTSAGRMGLVAAAGLGAIVVASANFEQAMSNVAATGQDARTSFDELRQAAIDAGAATAFSASEAAAGIENLLKAGVSAKDVLGGGLSGALDLAAAGQLEVADAAEIAATAMTQFKLAGSDVPHIADLLAAGAGKAQGDVSDLSMALKQSGLVASQMGVSIEETTGTLAAFASAGLLGSDAGTSFRTMLLRLANPTKESADLMADLGIQAYDAQGNFVGMASVADQLKVAFEGKTQAERDSALATIFGSDAIRAASVLYDQGAAGVNAWTANVNDAGYAAETAATRLDNLKGDLEALKGSLETALIGAGDGSAGPLRKMVQGLTDVINVFNKLPTSAKGVASSLLAITAVTGGGLWFGAKVIGGINGTRKALADLSAIGPGAARGLSLVAKAGGALAALEVGTAIIDSLRESAKGAAPDVDKLSAAISAVDASALQDALGGNLTDLLDSLDTGAFEKLSAGVGEYVDKMGLAGDAIDVFVPGLHSTQDIADKAASALTSLDDALAALAATEGPKRAEAALKTLAKTEGLSTSELQRLTDALPKYQAAIGGAAGGTSDAVTAFDVLRDAIFRLSGGPEKLAGQEKFLKRFFKSGADGAVDFADEIDGAADSIDGLSAAMNQLAGFLDREAAMRAYADAVKETAKALKDGFQPKDKETIQGIGDEIVNITEALAKKPAQQKSALLQAKEDLEGFIATNPKAKDAVADILKYVNRGLDGLDSRPPAEPPIGADTSEFDRDEASVRRRHKALNFLKAHPTVDLNDAQFSTVFRLTAADLAWLDHKTSHPKVDLNAESAISKLYQVKSLLGGLKSKSISITTYLATVHRPAGGGADGMTVPGQRSPYGDKDIYALAPGEEVISNRHGQADKNRAALKAANAGATLAVVGMAAGGTVATYARGLANGGTVDSTFQPFNVASDISRGLDSVFIPWAQILKMELKAAEHRRDDLKKDLDAARDFRDSLRDAAKSLKDSVAGIFSGADLFGAEDASFASIMSGLGAAENQGNLFQQLILRLKAMGLDGNALQSLISSGNVGLLQDFAGQSASDLAAFESQFNATQQSAQQVGQTAAFTVFGERQAEANALLAEARDEFREANRLAKIAQKKYDAQIAATKNVGKDTARELGPQLANANRRNR